MAKMEIWKDVVGYEGLYKISNFGNVKSLERKILIRNSFYRTIHSKIMGIHDNSYGYNTVDLSKNGKKRTIKVHKLMAIAFLNHTPKTDGFVVNHINHKRNDNRLENIELMTQRENANRKHLKSSSKYVGVSWSNLQKKWYSCIRINGKSKNLGYFNCELEAHNAYQNKLKTISL
jgi:hypothetical protein